MGQFKYLSIKDVIEEINVSYFLPDTQYEYLMLENAEEKRTEQFFDSILKGYPVGSFLIRNLKNSDIDAGKLQLHRFPEKYDEREIQNTWVDAEHVKSDDLHIVLYGRQ